MSKHLVQLTEDHKITSKDFLLIHFSSAAWIKSANFLIDQYQSRILEKLNLNNKQSITLVLNRRFPLFYPGLLSSSPPHRPKHLKEDGGDCFHKTPFETTWDLFAQIPFRAPLTSC